MTRDSEGVERMSRLAWGADMLRALLGNPWLVRLLALTVLLQLISSWFARPLFTCPFHATTGLSCPGCGLSRSLLSLLRMELGTMWRLHPFAPAFVLFGLELGSTLLAPASRREALVKALITFEEHTRLHAVLLLIFLTFGLLRLAVGVAHL